ncbi:DUF3540 domain-containing protein [Taylorella equigenitalis]|uniref:DUF3540 domain-containing protein n=1 Tax=Taylorella equigenitalis TaxID=29575 RepID=UPI00237C8A4A|nr:DUF3540 domain-containing protein [Taylorella equigenitalis]WDU54937.1 DUF3540 domain-containing protein [Taylorella equigenitalis]
MPQSLDQQKEVFIDTLLQKSDELNALLSRQARGQEDGSSSFTRGTITNFLGGGLCEVQLTSQETIQAQKAAFCHHTLAIGDKVLIDFDQEDGHFILGVLKAVQNRKLTLDFTNVETIKSHELQFTGQRLRFEAHDMWLAANNHLNLNTNNVEIVSVTYDLKASDIRSTSKNYDIKAQSIRQNFQQSRKVVQGVDRVDARSIQYTADISANLQSKKNVTLGTGTITLDGKLTVVS